MTPRLGTPSTRPAVRKTAWATPFGKEHHDLEGFGSHPSPARLTRRTRTFEGRADSALFGRAPQLGADSGGPHSGATLRDDLPVRRGSVCRLGDSNRRGFWRLADDRNPWRRSRDFDRGAEPCPYRAGFGLRACTVARTQRNSPRGLKRRPRTLQQQGRESESRPYEAHTRWKSFVRGVRSSFAVEFVRTRRTKLARRGIRSYAAYNARTPWNSFVRGVQSSCAAEFVRTRRTKLVRREIRSCTAYNARMSRRHLLALEATDSTLPAASRCSRLDFPSWRNS